MSLSCVGCVFWKSDQRTGGETGECRIRAPQIIGQIAKSEWKKETSLSEAVDFATRFPITAFNDWCGEHKPLPEQLEDSPCS